MPYLVLYPDEQKQKRIHLGVGQHSVGRLAESDVYVKDRSLSRRHAMIHVARGATHLTDLGSKNGTFLGGRRVSRTVLASGDLVQFGDVKARFDEDQAPRSSPPTAVHDPRADRNRAPIQTMLASEDFSEAADASSRALERLRILLKVSELLSSPGALDELLERICDLAVQILDVERVCLLLADEADGELRLRASRSELESAEGVPYSQRIVDYVRERKLGALFADAQFDPELDGAMSVLMGSIRSSMCAPLLAQDGLIGVLYMDNLSTPNRFDEEDLRFVTAFANQCAISIDNARLSARLAQAATVRSSLLRYFPPSTAERLLAEGSGPAVVEAEVTALFCDICGFTTLAGDRPPREIVGLLNAYFPTLAEVVFGHEGTVEKYIGDALLAVWGAPFSHADDADRAVNAAVDMQRAVRELREENEQWRELQVHIGLNTGVVAAGPIGSQEYLQYATIGDATNLASRVCGLAVADEILITDATRRRLGRSWDLQDRGPSTVRGRAEPLALHLVRWGETE